MIIGAILIFTWLILLLRYPAKALPVSLAAAVGLGIVAGVVVWQDKRDAQRLNRLQLRLDYTPEKCPSGRPLLVLVDNGNDVPLQALRWKVAAYAPGTPSISPTTPTPPRATAAPASCCPAANGRTACHCRHCAQAIARRPWNSVPNACKALSPTDTPFSKDQTPCLSF